MEGEQAYGPEEQLPAALPSLLYRHASFGKVVPAAVLVTMAKSTGAVYGAAVIGSFGTIQVKAHFGICMRRR